MFEKFYGLRTNPFRKTPDPEFLYMGASHTEALARLEYAVAEREVMLLTGEVGCGKTTLSRALLDSLDESYLPAILIGPLFIPGELLRLVALKAGIDNPSELRTELLEQIGSRLFDLYQQGRCLVLIVDEAQLIPGREGLDELRVLTNLQLDDTNLFSMVLLGQPELRARMLSGYNEPFRQRIGVQYHINPFGAEEVGNYVRFRLTRAGRTEPLFTEPALEALYKYSEGIPRKINNLAAGSLLEGFGKSSPFIDRDIITDVAKDFGLLHWNL